jgi:hypothetical protein
MTTTTDTLIERLRGSDPVAPGEGAAWAQSAEAEMIFARIVGTDAAPAPITRRSGGRWRARALVIALAACALITAAVLPLPGSEEGGVVERASVVDRALAAVGAEGPVVHFIIREESADPSVRRVQIATGREVPVRDRLETEVWYDDAGAVLRQIDRRGGVAISDLLWDKSGAISSRGPIATRPGQKPTFGAALTRSAAGYREALAEDAARVVGEGTVTGRPVYWLEFTLRTPAPIGGVATDNVERVAIDRTTYEPLLLRRLVDGQVASEAEVLMYENVARSAANFARPDTAAYAHGGDVESKKPVTLAQAQTILGRPLLIPGAGIDGVRLDRVTHYVLSSNYRIDGHNETRLGDAVALKYGDNLTVTEMTKPEAALGFNGATIPGGKPIPPDGFADVLPFLGGLQAFARIDGLYVAVRSEDAQIAPLVSALRQLQEVAS